MAGTSDTGDGVFGSSIGGGTASTGVHGTSNHIGVLGEGGAIGVEGTSNNSGAIGTFGYDNSVVGLTGYGVLGRSTRGIGVMAIGGGIDNPSVGDENIGLFAQGGPNGYAVFADVVSGSGTGVFARTGSGTGVFARSGNGIGLHAVGGGATEENQSLPSAGILAEGGPSYGIVGSTDGVGGIGLGVPAGVLGIANSNYGITGISNSNTGIRAISTSGAGLTATSSTGTGVYAESASGTALVVNGSMQVQGNSIGQATLPGGATSVTVNTPAATTASNIILTPLGNPGGQLWVERAAGSFTILTSAAPANDVPVTYLIIN